MNIDEKDIKLSVSHERILKKLKSKLEDEDLRFIFLLGEHGVGKTFLLKSILDDNIGIKSFFKKLRIKIINVGEYSNSRQILNKVVGLKLKVLVYAILLCLLVAIYGGIHKISKDYVAESEFGKRILSTWYPDHWMKYSDFFSLSVGLFVFFFIYDKFMGFYSISKMFKKIYNCLSCSLKVKRVWIDDLERSALAYNEQWSLIESLSSYPDTFLITIGYESVNDKKLYLDRIHKFRDNLMQSNGGKRVLRIFELEPTPETNYNLFRKYMDIHLGYCPLLDDVELYEKWIVTFTPREINEILITIDSLHLACEFSMDEFIEYVKIEKTSKVKSIDTKVDLDNIVVTLLTVKVLFRFICLKYGIDLKEFLRFFDLGLSSNQVKTDEGEYCNEYHFDIEIYKENIDFKEIENTRFYSVNMRSHLNRILRSIKYFERVKKHQAIQKNVLKKQHCFDFTKKSIRYTDFIPLNDFLIYDHSNKYLMDITSVFFVLE